MSHLPGNPFAERIESLADDHAEVATALAIAFEIRTQTLAAIHQMAVTSLGDTAYADIPETMREAMREQSADIEDRLGGANV